MSIASVLVCGTTRQSDQTKAWLTWPVTTGLSKAMYIRMWEVQQTTYIVTVTLELGSHAESQKQLRPIFWLLQRHLLVVHTWWHHMGQIQLHFRQVKQKKMWSHEILYTCTLNFLVVRHCSPHTTIALRALMNIRMTRVISNWKHACKRSNRMEQAPEILSQTVFSHV